VAFCDGNIHNFGVLPSQNATSSSQIVVLLEFIWNKATNPVPPASFAVDSMEI
jgi:hypothetical protein